MSDLLIKNAIVYTNDDYFSGWVSIKNGIIASMGGGDAPNLDVETIDAMGQRLLPGFIDTHVHGAVGHDTMDADLDGLQKMAQFFASRGVTAFTPTTLTSSHEQILAALESIKPLVGADLNGADIVGVHLEGPYLNVEKCGAQNPDFVRLCDPEEAWRYFVVGILKIVSLAPEFPENEWLIEACKAAGISASIAHTNATYKQAIQSIDRGIQRATHTYNAMTSLHHRQPGVVGAVLSDDRIHCELIADNIHVHPAAMKTLWRAKGRDKITLISDAMRAAGLSDGEYMLEDLIATVKDGRVTLKNGTLAGSILTMDKAILNFMTATGASLREVLPTFSLNPAKAIGLGHRKGSIEQGKDADLVLASANFEIQQTIVRGRVVYKNSSD